MVSSCIYLIVKDRVSFFFYGWVAYNNVYIHHGFLIWLPVESYLDGFCILTTWSWGAINISLFHIILVNSLGWNGWVIWKLCFQISEQFLFSLLWWLVFPPTLCLGTLHSHQHWLFLILLFCLGWCEVSWWFLVAFPDYLCIKRFFISVGLLYFIFWKMSVHFLSSFLNWFIGVIIVEFLEFPVLQTCIVCFFLCCFELHNLLCVKFPCIPVLAAVLSISVQFTHFCVNASCCSLPQLSSEPFLWFSHFFFFIQWCTTDYTWALCLCRIVQLVCKTNSNNSSKQLLIILPVFNGSESSDPGIL